MDKYLTIFGSHSQYVEPEVKPNVSYCIQEDEVHYNPLVPNLYYRTVNSYKVLCNNEGQIYRLNYHDTFYLGWNNSSTKLFHNMHQSGDYDIVSNAISTYGTVNGNISFTTTMNGNTITLTNNTFTFEGNSYVFSSGEWTPEIPEYIEPNNGGTVIQK